MKKLEHTLIQHWYHKNNFLLSIFVMPLSWLFGIIIFFRKKYYDLKHALSKGKQTIPVIIIGNITVGGGGKTPMVIEVVNHLKSRGLKPAVITRGYKRNTKQLHLVNSESSVSDTGDEPYLIYQKTHVPIAIDSNRIKALEAILKHHPECNIVIADDGLQHYNLQRDFEIVMYDSQRGFGNEYILPMGPLREPLSRLKQADLVIPKQISITQFRNLKTHVTQPATFFFRKKCIATAGIANPDNFYDLLKLQGIKFEIYAISDHEKISEQKMTAFKDYCVLITEKDAVKYKDYENVWIAETAFDLPKHVVKALDDFLSVQPKATSLSQLAGKANT